MIYMELKDNQGRIIVAPDAVEEVIVFVKDCETNKQIHPDLADEIIALIAKDANLLVKELTNAK